MNGFVDVLESVDCGDLKSRIEELKVGQVKTWLLGVLLIEAVKGGLPDQNQLANAHLWQLIATAGEGGGGWWRMLAKVLCLVADEGAAVTKRERLQVILGEAAASWNGLGLILEAQMTSQIYRELDVELLKPAFPPPSPQIVTKEPMGG
ncbi:hypothetical protein Droror1_Dr00024271 [Drosera rotundifolia]